MNCTFSEKSSSLIDGELSTVEAREVEHHMLSCSECEQLRADFLNLRSQITSFETSLQPEVQNRALKKILASPRRAPARGFQWNFGTQALGFAMLLIVAAIIGFVAYQNSNKQREQKAVAVVVQTPSPAPAATVEPAKQPEPKESPEPQSSPSKGNEEKSRPAPARRPIVREPKPGEQFAAIPEPVRSADAETMTAMHFETSERL